MLHLCLLKYDDDDDNGYSSTKSYSKFHSTHNSADWTKAPSLHSHPGIFESIGLHDHIVSGEMIPPDLRNSALVSHKLRTHITREKYTQTRKSGNCRTSTRHATHSTAPNCSTIEQSMIQQIFPVRFHGRFVSHRSQSEVHRTIHQIWGGHANNRRSNDCFRCPIMYAE